MEAAPLSENNRTDDEIDLKDSLIVNIEESNDNAAIQTVAQEVYDCIINHWMREVVETKGHEIKKFFIGKNLVDRSDTKTWNVKKLKTAIKARNKFDGFRVVAIIHTDGYKEDISSKVKQNLVAKFRKSEYKHMLDQGGHVGAVANQNAHAASCIFIGFTLEDGATTEGGSEADYPQLQHSEEDENEDSKLFPGSTFPIAPLRSMSIEDNKDKVFPKTPPSKHSDESSEDEDLPVVNFLDYSPSPPPEVIVVDTDDDDDQKFPSVMTSIPDVTIISDDDDNKL